MASFRVPKSVSFSDKSDEDSSLVVTVESEDGVVSKTFVIDRYCRMKELKKIVAYFIGHKQFYLSVPGYWDDPPGEMVVGNLRRCSKKGFKLAITWLGKGGTIPSKNREYDGDDEEDMDEDEEDQSEDDEDEEDESEESDDE